jgi:hypothetical protein
MAIDTSTLEATLQNKFDNVTDPKEMLLLGKAYEATVGGIAVSDIEDAGAAQVATINQVATNTFKTVSGQSILGTGDIAADDASALTTGILDAARLPAGSIIQTKFLKFDSKLTGNAQYYDIGMDLSITPTSASSKILVWTNVHLSVSGTTVGYVVYRNGSPVDTLRGTAMNDTARLSATSNGHTSSWSQATSFMGVDSPNTTSPVTYDVRVGAHTTGYTWLVNRTNSTGGSAWDEASRTSTMILMEIKQ